jgi:hypothetical protein
MGQKRRALGNDRIAATRSFNLVIVEFLHIVDPLRMCAGRPKRETHIRVLIFLKTRIFLKFLQTVARASLEGQVSRIDEHVAAARYCSEANLFGGIMKPTAVNVQYACRCSASGRDRGGDPLDCHFRC